jgi:hypothetical protein
MNSATIYSNSGALISSIKASNEDFHRRLKKLYPCVDDVSQLPHGWSVESKAPPLGLTQDNLGCYYRGNGRREEDEKFAAAVRTDNSIPPSCLLYYFEIKFISKGREGFMGLGLTSATALLNKLPGWVRDSYGYHADDGNIFNGDGRGNPFGPTFTSGDIIGCGYNLVEGKCFFTKNGLSLGKAFEDIPSDIMFYPTIGLKTSGEEIRANFGQEDFAYDIEQDLRSLRKNMTLTISNYPINDFGNWRSTLHKLVQSWLFQNSYPKTAEAFTRSAKMECKENMQRIQLRNRIQQYVLNGKISEAIELTNRLCPNMLQNNPNLLFALKCRQFVELISGAESDFQPTVPTIDNEIDFNEQKFAKLILFGQELCDYLHQLNKLYGKNETNEKMLLDAVGLIAFINPHSSYHGKLLDPKERESISQILNNSILKAETGDSYRSPMEDVMHKLRDLVRLNNSQGRWLIDQLY